jgi:putative salt-induced outer membrane protein
MNCSRLWILSVVAALPMTCVWADDPPPPNGVWTGKGQAGFVGSQGNTDAESINAAIDMALVDNQWKHALHFGALYGESSGITAAERWDALWQTNYSLTSDLYTFGALRYEHDDFSGFEYQGSATAGLGYKILNTDATKLSGQVGVGYRKSQPEELTKDAEGAVISRTLEPSTSDAILTAGLDFSQVITSTTNLTNKFLMETGSSDTLYTDALALTIKMSGKLALSVGYSVQDNTNPPAGLKKLDTVETVNLVYSF